MPRFGVTSHEDISSTADVPVVPVPAHRKPRLCCQGRQNWVHTLLPAQHIIESCRLGDARRTQRPLPRAVATALRRDAPLELLVLNNINNGEWGDTADTQFVIYTSRQAFIVTFSPDAAPSYEEPFHSSTLYSAHSGGCEIVRVRHPYTGSVLRGPATDLVALVYVKSLFEYAILVAQGTSATIVTTSVVIKGRHESGNFTDFCFGSSWAAPSTNGAGALSLLAATSVLLLHATGDIFTAGPVVIDGSLTATKYVTEAMNYCELQQASSATDRGTPSWRRHRAAQQFLADVWCPHHNFSIARVFQVQAGSWPVQTQGPVVFGPQDDENSSHETTAVAMESMSGGNNIVGAAVVWSDGTVRVAVLSPTCLVPRFMFESDADRYYLDDECCGKLGTWVECLALRDDRGAVQPDFGSVGLVRDSVQNTMLHVVTDRAVYTVSTEALKKFGRPPSGPPLESTAWIGLQTSDSCVSIQGVAVPNECKDEHRLIAWLSDGSMPTVAIFEQQLTQAVTNKLASPPAHKSRGPLLIQDGSSSLASLDSQQPLYDMIQKMLPKIQEGLNGLAKFVGSDTSYDKISEDRLAVVLKVKERCDNTLVVPLLEFQNKVATRREALRAVVKEQRRQLEHLARTQQDIIDKEADIAAKLATVHSNSSILIERALHVEQACHDFIPRATKAEIEFSVDMGMLQDKCTEVEETTETLRNAIIPICEKFTTQALDASIVDVHQKQVETAHKLLNGGSVTLKEMRARATKLSERIKDIAKRAY